MQHLLKMLDLNSKELEQLLNLSDQMKYEQRHGISRRLLEGRALGMIFHTPSTRTRVTFELGTHQLGGHSLYLPTEAIQLGRGESIEDTARTMSCFCDAVVMRTYAQEEVDELAHFGTIPVINGMTDLADPLLALTMLMTVREKKGRLDGLKLAFIGDGNARMNSIIVGALKSRMNVAVACPEGYDPDDSVLDYAAQVGHFEMYRDPRGAARAADVVITDSWIPVGLENEYEQRLSDFRGFTLSSEVMNYAKPDASVLHCLPARREEEITSELFDQHSIAIFEACDNRLHVAKAVLCAVFGL
ncbi:MAG: ornithine carbamoyltransferase [Ruminococcaceae bacterium]|nr:ornithine carbamoyltransferase [Oscillospiraceae bacterium]